VTAAVTFNWSLAWQYRGQLLDGLVTALEVAAVALVISVAVGLVLALGRMSRTPIRWLAALWVNVFRGVPALVSVLWVYFGWSLLLGVNLTPFESGVVALVLLYGAFHAEIYRSAFEAVPHGQREAGLALGLRRSSVFLHVTLPQATKVAIPNVGSMFIGMVKDTSVFSVVGLLEVIRVTDNIESTTFQPFVLYTVAAAIYVVVAFLLDFSFRLAERTLTKPPAGPLSRLVTLRRRRRLEAIAARTGAALPPLSAPGGQGRGREHAGIAGASSVPARSVLPVNLQRKKQIGRSNNGTNYYEQTTT
jgi:His/Glu/Gln/Arg/opine family amino acid ABC transporter permease subunit